MENFVQLNPDEKIVLESVYGRQIFGGVGYNPRKLEATRELTSREKKFLRADALQSQRQRQPDEI